MTMGISGVNLNDYKPLREVIFNTLREAIITGELVPGERLMEIPLAKKMGVSRTPIREAIRKLELEGLVIMIPRKGAHVSQLTAKSIKDVLEIRACLDGFATSLAAYRITDDEIEELRKVYKEFVIEAENKNLLGALKKDIAFHDVIYKASGNDHLTSLLSNLWEQVQRYRIIFLKDYCDFQELISEHSEIIDCIAMKNPEVAKVVAEKHIKNQAEAIVKAIEIEDQKNL